MDFKARTKTWGGHRNLNTYQMAKAYINDARLSLEEAKYAYNNKAYHRVVRRSQECVELSLKGILRLLGVEYKNHDISEALIEAKNHVKIPSWLIEKLEILQSASQKLAQQRGLSFYGDEKALSPPENLYTIEDAEEAIKLAETTLQTAERLLKEYSPTNNQ